MDMDKKTPEAKKKALPKKPATFLTIDNTNMLGWLISCFIICGGMFFLGVLVGRNTAPVQFDVNRLEEKLSNLQISVLKQKETEKTQTRQADMSAETEVSVGYEDIIDQLTDKGKTLEIYEQFVPPVLTPKYAKTPPPKQQPEPVVKRSAAPEPKKQAVKTKPYGQSKPMAMLKPEIRSLPVKDAAPVVKPESRTVRKTVPATEQTIPKVTKTKPAGQEFAIQVASLKDPEKAKMLMSKFKEKGYPAFCQRSEVNGATWHRVRLGPYLERALADKDQGRLKAAGVDSLIISMH